jgi:hypothetical protein
MRFAVASLPDFTNDTLMNRLRAAMGADLVAPISELQIAVLTLDEILRTTGQEVDIGEIEFADDGTLMYKGRHVILYIRDKSFYNDKLQMPKFHLANCTTLKEMWAKKRSERYVVSTRDSGLFKMNISRDGGTTWNESEEPLDVCKNCLSTLDWDGYGGASASTKRSIFDEFELEGFFKRYPNSPVTFTPLHTDVTAPINDYPANFLEVSKAFRESVSYRCQGCGTDLSDQKLRRFLHVHHKDGIKSNCSASNLMALCIECHIGQANHGHLANSPDFHEYRMLRRKSSPGYRIV